MNKDLIKLKLTNLISEEKPKGLVSTEKTQKEEDNINKDYYKEVDKKMGEYDKSSKKEDKNAIEPVKYNYSESDKEIHDEVEIRNGLEMTRYDNEPDEKFKERAEMAIVGDSKMGNKDNSEPTFGGSTKDFAKNLVKTIKKSTKKRNDSITPIVQFGDDVEVLPKDTKKIANKRKVALEGIKRLNYKKEFNGLENAINLIPETYKVDKKVFEMADINETYRIRWEGTVNEGQAIVLKAENKKLVNESMDKIKHLMGFKSSDTSGRLNSAERLAEETNFTKVWDKAKSVIKEDFEVHYSDGIRQGKSFRDLNKAMSFAKQLTLTPKMKEVSVFNAKNGFHSTTQDEYLIGWWGEGSYYDNVSKKRPELLNKKINVNNVSENTTQ
jgi:hypothetical protein